MWGFRTGAKPEEINRIREMTEAGNSVAQISRVLQIEEKCVLSFVEHFQKKNQPKQLVQAQSVEVPDEDLAAKGGRKRIAEKLEGMVLPQSA